jgi:hypothetical protein
VCVLVRRAASKRQPGEQAGGWHARWQQSSALAQQLPCAAAQQLPHEWFTRLRPRLHKPISHARQQPLLRRIAIKSASPIVLKCALVKCVDIIVLYGGVLNVYFLLATMLGGNFWH